jgi:hypothetical protein
LIEQIEICCVELSSHCSEVNLDLVWIGFSSKKTLYVM